MAMRGCIRENSTEASHPHLIANLSASVTKLVGHEITIIEIYSIAGLMAEIINNLQKFLISYFAEIIRTRFGRKGWIGIPTKRLDRHSD